MPTQVEEDAMEAWDHKDAVARYLLSQRLPDSIMYQVGECLAACASWEQVAEHCKKERAWDLPEEAFVATKHEGRRTRRRGKCHSCGKERESQRAHECCTSRRGMATALAPQTSSGATRQPKAGPVDTADSVSTIVLEGGSFWMAEEEATRAHDGSAELGLPRGHGEDPSPQVHAQIVAAEPDPILSEEDTFDVVAHTQTVVVEPDAILDGLDALKDVAHAQLVSVEPDLQVGEPETPKEVAHAQMVDAEPDWILWGKPGTPNKDAPVHLAGTEHKDEILMGARDDEPDDWLLQEMEEEGAAEKTTSIEGDNDPRIKLQKSGVSHLASQEGIKSLTFSSSPLPITSEAVRTQRLPVVDTGTPAIPETEGSADLPPLHDPPPLPDKVPPEQIRAPADARGLVESPWGEVSQRTTWHNGQSQTRGPEGKEPPTETARGEALQHAMWQVGQTSVQGVTPLGEAHGCPPNLPDPYPRGSATLEHVIVDPKACARVYEAWRPVPDKCTCARPEPWPGTGGENEDSDAYTRASVLLEGEQNMILPSVRSEQYATPCTPLPVDPLPPETLTRETLHGEGAAPVRRAADEHHLAPLKPPDLVIEDLGEAGGVLPAVSDAHGLPESPKRLGLVRAAVEMHEPGGVLSATSAVPAPTEETAGVKLVGTAERAAAAEPEVLEPWADDETGCGPHTAPGESPTVGEQVPEPLLREAMAVDGCKHGLETLSQEGLPPGGRTHDTVPRKSLIDGEHACNMAPQYSSAGGERMLEALLLKAATMDTGERVLEAPLPQGDMAERTPEALPQGSLTEGMAGCDHDAPLQESTTVHEHELETPLQGLPIERGHATLPRQEGVGGTPECRPTRGHLTGGARGPDRPSRVVSAPGRCERRCWRARQKPPWRQGALASPRRRHPGGRDTSRGGLLRPEEWARRALLLAQEDTPGRPKIRVSAAAPPTNRPLTFFFACTTSNRPF
jgi:hypothetical protein